MTATSKALQLSARRGALQLCYTMGAAARSLIVPSRAVFPALRGVE